MFFKNTLKRIEDKLDNIEYLIAEKTKTECDHPCTDVYIRPDAGTWTKVCGKCKETLDWYNTEIDYLRAKQDLMAEIMKVDKERIRDLEKAKPKKMNVGEDESPDVGE